MILVGENSFFRWCRLLRLFSIIHFHRIIKKFETSSKFTNDYWVYILKLSFWVFFWIHTFSCVVRNKKKKK